MLWELVHVFFEHRGLLAGRDAAAHPRRRRVELPLPVPGRAGDDLDAVLDDVRRSVLMKAQEIGALRAATLTDNRDALIAAAAALRDRFDAGGKLLALGNGGSATDAMDVVADFRSRRAIPRST